MYIKNIFHHDQIVFTMEMEWYFIIYKSIYITNHINVLKDENHMIITMDLDKDVDKIQQTFIVPFKTYLKFNVLELFDNFTSPKNILFPLVSTSFQDDYIHIFLVNFWISCHFCFSVISVFLLVPGPKKNHPLYESVALLQEQLKLSCSSLHNSTGNSIPLKKNVL